MKHDLPPEPLVADGVDLRDFPFMPLDVVRLRDSGLAAKATGDEFRAAVLLWCASWHQIPAGSLPDDDVELANLCGYGRALKEWGKVRSGALRGWIKCSDGRLYHPTVAGKAAEAWAKKLAQRTRTEAARKAREQQRQKQSQAQLQPLSQRTQASVTDTVTESKGQGQGQGQGQGDLEPPDGSLRSPSAPAVAAATGADASQGQARKAELWRRGRALLLQSGVAEATAGEFVGSLVRDYGQVLVLDAIADAEQATPADPRAWLVARCQERRASGREAGDAWWSSDAKIDAKGRSLGMMPRAGESWAQYRDRIAECIAERKRAA